ncbi:alpha/beta hydrolase [Gordonia insulae]
MPGTGSDADYVQRAFGPAAEALGLTLVALEPASDLVAGHRRRLDELSARADPIIVGGVSIGAAIALEWALHHPCAGVWAALPAWTGDPATAPAAWSATATARALSTDGLEQTIAAMATTSPAWLAAELDRSWRALYPALLGQLTEAAALRSPELDEIATLRVPLAVTAAVDDPVHPHHVGRDWAAAAPRSGLTEVTLDDWGADPSVLGFGCARAWLGIS